MSFEVTSFGCVHLKQWFEKMSEALSILYLCFDVTLFTDVFVN